MPPRPRSPVVRAVRTPEALEALRAKLDSFADSIRDSGAALFKTGAVSNVRSEADHLVRAEVASDQRCIVTWFLTRGAWSSGCSCSLKKDCQHAYAVGLGWLASVDSGTRDGRDPGEVLAVGESSVFASPTERALESELGAWLRALPSPEETTFAATVGAFAGLSGLRVRLDRDGRWLVEVQPSADKPWKSPTQKWLTDLGTLRPADFQALPAAEAALAAALAAEVRLAPAGLVTKRPLPPAAVSGLLRTRAALPALAMPDGSPFTMEPDALVFEAVASTGDTTQLELRLVAPDGRVADDAVLIAPRPEPLYLFDGRVWRGPPPPPSPSARLPVAALTDTRLLPRLRAAGLRLPAGLAAEVRLITLRPHLKCWLTPTFDGEERDFHAQLTAGADHPPCEQHFTDDAGGWRWGKKTTPPPRVVGEPVLEFDLSKARIASSRFAGFRLIWDGWAEAWTRPVTNTFPEDFLAWHAAQAPGLDIEVSPELAALFGEPLRAHVDFSVEAAPGAEQDWFDLTVALRVEDTSLSEAEIALLLKARGKWVNLPRHGWRRVETAVDVNASSAAALDRLGLGVEDVISGGRPTRHRLHALQLALEAEALADRDAMWVHVLKDRISQIAATPPAELPTELRATLRPYQCEGFQFLAHLSAQNFGGVLADDMGLGKTVQTLAWLLHLKKEKAAKNAKIAKLEKANAGQNAGAGSAVTEARPFRVLIVCPKSVTHGWLTEATRFAPTLTIEAYSPDYAAANAVSESRAELLRAASSETTAAGGITNSNSLGNAHAEPELLVANYTQLRMNAQEFRSVVWDVVVLDEGQFIKNPGSQVAVVARSLRAHHRVILTGTPIENRLADLWSLFAFAQPGLLGDQASFRRQYNEADPAALSRLHRRVRHFLLRRTKSQAAPDLPSRTEDEIVVDLEGEQRGLYDAELKRARAQLLGVETAKALDAVRFHVLASLLRLRQICCHPALVDPAHANLPSAKLEALLERVEELAEEGHQVLVFSQFVGMLNIIRERLIASGIGHLILTGATENRAELVETFQTDRTKTVFLLSLKAAGFGLNLTAASYAILYDPWWNPAAEAQAIDRIHRIGQTKPVTAYRLLARGTVEEKIRVLQKEKSALASAVVQEESLATVMDLDSLRQILG